MKIKRFVNDDNPRQQDGVIVLSFVRPSVITTEMWPTELIELSDSRATVLYPPPQKKKSCVIYCVNNASSFDTNTLEY